MKRSRAYRLKQKERIRNKARKALLYSFYGFDELSDHEFEQTVCKLADNLSACSCPMCGNPRRHSNSKKGKLTIQERKAKEEDEIIGRD